MSESLLTPRSRLVMYCIFALHPLSICRLLVRSPGLSYWIEFNIHDYFFVFQPIRRSENDQWATDGTQGQFITVVPQRSHIRPCLFQWLQQTQGNMNWNHNSKLFNDYFCLTLLSTFLFVIGASTEAKMSALCIISRYTVTTNFCLQRLFCFTVSFRQGYGSNALRTLN